MPEIGTSGLTSGDGKRGWRSASARARPRLYRRLRIIASPQAPRRVSARQTQVSAPRRHTQPYLRTCVLSDIVYPIAFGDMAYSGIVRPERIAANLL